VFFDHLKQQLKLLLILGQYLWVVRDQFYTTLCCVIDNSQTIDTVLWAFLYSAKPDQVCGGWSVMNAESIVSFSNSSLDLSVKNRPATIFPIFPAIFFASSCFTVCFLAGFWSALSIASFLSSGTSSQKKARPTRSSVRYHKWFIMALTADLAICCQCHGNFAASW